MPLEKIDQIMRNANDAVRHKGFHKIFDKSLLLFPKIFLVIAQRMLIAFIEKLCAKTLCQEGSINMRYCKVAVTNNSINLFCFADAFEQLIRVRILHKFLPSAYQEITVPLLL